jgi:hypothetical protein
MTKPNDWKKEFDDLMDEMSMYADDAGISQVTVDKLWSWIENLLSSELDRQKKDLRKKIDLLIIQRMQKYANTPLKDRTNAFDVLYEINLEILKLLK